MRFAGGPDFTPKPLASAGGSSNFSSAASAVDLGDSFAAMRAKAPRYDEISALSMKTRSDERQAAMNAEADVMSNGIAAVSDAKVGHMTSVAQIKAAKEQAEATKSYGMMGAIGSIGSALIGLCDERTKNTIEELDDSLEKLRQLRPVSFYYNKELAIEPGRQHFGFIAQEYREVMPDAVYLNDESGYLCIDMTQLIALLVRSIQQLDGRVKELEAK